MCNAKACRLLLVELRAQPLWHNLHTLRIAISRENRCPGYLGPKLVGPKLVVLMSEREA
jgi:hypothetical protein